MPEFRFHAEDHRYTLDGRVLPSVTQIIAPLVNFSMVPADALEYARDRGTAVHKACELHDLDDLDEDALDESLRPYLAGWKQFLRDNNPKFGTIEEPMHHAILGYAGTPDRTGIIGDRGFVLDIKSSAQLSPAVGVQLSGYDLMAGPHTGVMADDLLAVRLCKDGTYRMKYFAKDHATFISCLTIFNFHARTAK